MAYEEPVYYNPTRTPAIIVIVLFLLFAAFHTSVITFFHNLGRRPEITVIISPSPYYTTNPATFAPSAVPQSLPGSHPTSLPGSTNQGTIAANDLPESGPADTFGLISGFLVIIFIGLYLLSSKNRLQKAIRGE